MISDSYQETRDPKGLEERFRIGRAGVDLFRRRQPGIRNRFEAFVAMEWTDSREEPS